MHCRLSCFPVSIYLFSAPASSVLFFSAYNIRCYSIQALSSVCSSLCTLDPHTHNRIDIVPLFITTEQKHSLTFYSFTIVDYIIFLSHLISYLPMLCHSTQITCILHCHELFRLSVLRTMPLRTTIKLFLQACCPW